MIFYTVVKTHLKGHFNDFVPVFFMSADPSGAAAGLFLYDSFK